MGFCCPSRDPSDRFADRCFNWFPCLSDPARRSTLCLQLKQVMLHLVFIGFIFIFDSEFIEKLKTQPWYTLVYLLLFVATLVQYFITCGSSPGYVLDAVRDFARADASLRASERDLKQRKSASSKNGTVVVTLDRDQLEETVLGDNSMNWTKLVMDMYPHGTSVSLQEQNIVLIATSAFFSLITIAFGWEHA